MLIAITVGIMLSKILAFILHPNLDEAEKATGTEFTVATDVFVIPLHFVLKIVK